MQHVRQTDLKMWFMKYVSNTYHPHTVVNSSRAQPPLYLSFITITNGYEPFSSPSPPSPASLHNLCDFKAPPLSEKYVGHRHSHIVKIHLGEDVEEWKSGWLEGCPPQHGRQGPPWCQTRRGAGAPGPPGRRRAPAPWTAAGAVPHRGPSCP